MIKYTLLDKKDFIIDKLKKVFPNTEVNLQPVDSRFSVCLTINFAHSFGAEMPDRKYTKDEISRIVDELEIGIIRGLWRGYENRYR